MALRLGDVVPDFRADSSHGAIALHDFIAGRWAILFSHPNDFTPVCTTELAAIARLLPDFTNRGVRLLALSCNDLPSHLAWIPDIESIARYPSHLLRKGSDSIAEASDPTHIGSDSSDSTATRSDSTPKRLDSSGFTTLGSDSMATNGLDSSGSTALGSDSMALKGLDSSDSAAMGSDSMAHKGLDSSDSAAMGSDSMANKGLDSSHSAAMVSDSMAIKGLDSSDSAATRPDSMATKGLDSSDSTATRSDSMATKGLHSSDSAAMGSDPIAKASDSSDSTATGSDPSGSIPMVWYPIVADPDRAISARLGILDPDELDPQGSSLAARSVLILGPDKKLKASILYPASTGRNFAEILRVVDSLQLTARYSVATPADWSHGSPCMVLPTLSDASARDKLPKGFCTIPVPSGKPYLRLTPQPDL